MSNPIAILISPPRFIAVGLGMLMLYGLAVLGAIETSSYADSDSDSDDICAVELLR